MAAEMEQERESRELQASFTAMATSNTSLAEFRAARTGGYDDSFAQDGEASGFGGSSILDTDDEILALRERRRSGRAPQPEPEPEAAVGAAGALQPQPEPEPEPQADAEAKPEPSASSAAPDEQEQEQVEEAEPPSREERMARLRGEDPSWSEDSSRLRATGRRSLAESLGLD